MLQVRQLGNGTQEPEVGKSWAGAGNDGRPLLEQMQKEGKGEVRVQDERELDHVCSGSPREAAVESE